MVNLSRLPIVVRIMLLMIAVALGLGLGFGLGLVEIRVAQAILGDFASRSLRGIVVIGGAYAITGLTGLVAFVLAWRGAHADDAGLTSAGDAEPLPSDADVGP